MNSDWYGWMKDYGNWVWHTEHGWQTFAGDSNESFFVYDRGQDLFRAALEGGQMAQVDPRSIQVALHRGHAVALVTVYASVFVVNERQQAIVLRFVRRLPGGEA